MDYSSAQFPWQQKFSIRALQNVKETVAVGLQQRLSRLALPFHVRQNRRLGRVPIEHVVRSESVVPLELSDQPELRIVAAGKPCNRRRVLDALSLPGFRARFARGLDCPEAPHVFAALLDRAATGGVGIVALHARPVTIINPRDPTGAMISEAQFRGVTLQSKGQAVRVLVRKAGEPLPLE